MEKRSEIGYENEATQCKQDVAESDALTEACTSCFVNSGVCLCNLRRLRCKLTQEPQAKNECRIINYDSPTYLFCVCVYAFLSECIRERLCRNYVARKLFGCRLFSGQR